MQMFAFCPPPVLRSLIHDLRVSESRVARQLKFSCDSKQLLVFKGAMSIVFSSSRPFVIKY